MSGTRYTCYACGAKVATAIDHGQIICETCYRYLRTSDVRSVRNVKQYLDLRHAGKSDYDARRTIGQLDNVI